MSRVLVVEDDLEVALPLLLLLEALGHSVRHARNGEEGLTEVSKEFPEIILLDVDMPRLTGPQMAYRLLIEDSGRENIPIVLLSGIDQLSTVAAMVGTPYFLSKPYRLDDLTAMLNRVFRALKNKQSSRPAFLPAHRRKRGIS